MNELILVVEDQPKIAKIAKDYLERAGFRVLNAYDGRTALAVFRNDKPDFVILDLNLPVLDGLDVCRAIRRESDIPIIMLTSRSEETDKLIGLELGADDYIVKPFSPRELVARVRTVMRRVQGEIRMSGIIRARDLEIDLSSHRVTVAGKTVNLTPTEFSILSVLAQRPGQVLSREQLLDQLHTSIYPGIDRSIDSHIKNIRKKIEPDMFNLTYIHTVYGIGYKFTDGQEA